MFYVVELFILLKDMRYMKAQRYIVLLKIP